MIYTPERQEHYTWAFCGLDEPVWPDKAQPEGEGMGVRSVGLSTRSIVPYVLICMFLKSYVCLSVSDGAGGNSMFKTVVSQH